MTEETMQMSKESDVPHVSKLT